jgi:hypothetical protein
MGLGPALAFSAVETGIPTASPQGQEGQGRCPCTPAKAMPLQSNQRFQGASPLGGSQGSALAFLTPGG